MYPAGFSPSGSTAEPSLPRFFQDRRRQLPTKSSAFNDRLLSITRHDVALIIQHEALYPAATIRLGSGLVAGARNDARRRRLTTTAELLVVGAGPYALSTAALAREQGVDVVVLARPM